MSAIADELTRLTRARSKTGAVRTARRHEIERARQNVPLRERLARAKAREIGPNDLTFDIKAFTDEMCGGI